MLFLSRTLTTVTYVSSYTKDVRLSDMLVQPIFRITIGILIMLPIYLLYKKHENKNLLDLARERSTKLSKVISFFYIVAFFYFTVVTIARLDVFTGTVVFPETNVNFMLVFVIIFCCYGAYLGYEISDYIEYKCVESKIIDIINNKTTVAKIITPNNENFEIRKP
jgi:hypothetical protein